jgi:putative NADPH-quinone reductase
MAHPTIDAGMLQNPEPSLQYLPGDNRGGATAFGDAPLGGLRLRQASLQSTAMHPISRMATRAPHHPNASARVSRRILVLLAHPSLDRSEVNRPLAEAAAGVAGVTLVDLYAEYPTFQIDVDREQQRLRDHDIVIFQHPLYWYSTPAILKEWQDLVLEHGFAYGSTGTALAGKLLFNALTAGGPEAAYRAEGANHYTIRELLHPIEQTAVLCRMTYLPPFALFGARTAVEDGRLGSHLTAWATLLQALRDDCVDIAQARARPTLSGALDDIIKPAAAGGAG